MVIMDVRAMALGTMGILINSLCHAQTPNLNLYTFESPPYQMAGETAGHITGETVKTVSCAAGEAGWSIRVRITPQNRATHSLRRNLIDGYFAIDPSAELDAIATRSNPISLEKWYFFTTKPGPIAENARIGVVDGSNEKTWLEANGYNIFLTVSSPGQLPALLKRERIDAALMDTRAMAGLQPDEKSENEELRAHFLRYAPLYLYLSDNFNASHPAFLAAFNQHLPACMEGQITLSPEEERRVRVLAWQLFTEVDSLLNLPQAIDSGPRIEALTDVLNLDSKWQALAPETATDLARTILELPGSRALHDWALTHNGLVTEVLLTNNIGALAAMSQLSSDYWQGDEDKFIQVVKNLRKGSAGLDAIHISNIRYDASTSRFQVTVSAPVGPVSDDLPKGILALGLDVEVALAHRVTD